MTAPSTNIPIELVLDINPGISSSDPQGLTAAGGMLYFFANDGTGGQSLWWTGPIKELTKRIGSTNVDLTTYLPVTTPSGNSLFFWNKSEGTTEIWTSIFDSMRITKKIHPEAGPHWFQYGWTSEIGVMPSSHLSHINQNYGRDIAYFQAYTDATGIELWRSDGTTEGTYLLKDIWEGDGWSRPHRFAPAGNFMFFVAEGETTGSELWKTDGTKEGTRLVSDIVPGRRLSSDPKYLTALGDDLFFTAWSGQEGANRELWKYDTSEAKTFLYKDINLLGSSDPSNLTTTDGFWLYFVADDGIHGRELWTTRPVYTGNAQVLSNDARLVHDINPGANSSLPQYLTASGGKLYFSALDSSGSRSLWVSDHLGAKKVDAGGLDPLDFVPSGQLFNQHVYYTATDPKDPRRPRKIYRSDGTEQGTYPLELDIDYTTQTIYGGLALDRLNERQDTLVKAGDYLYFSIHDQNGTGRELWRVDIRDIESKSQNDFSSVEIVGKSESDILNDKTWNSISFDLFTNAKQIVNQLLEPLVTEIAKIQELKEIIFLDVTASTWQGKVKIKSVGQASNKGGDRVDATQIEFGAGPQGSVLNGGSQNDTLWGRAGWDIIDGGEGDDLIRGGNGRDIITGGLGRDELHGDFGWNTFKSEKDGFSDLIVVKSDQWLSNWLLGGAGNNADGSKCDIIEGLDTIDKIKILGVATDDLTFQAGVAAQGTSGIGIYAKGALEALYTGGDLSVDQLRRMTTGDTNLSALEATGFYGVW